MKTKYLILTAIVCLCAVLVGDAAGQKSTHRKSQQRTSQSKPLPDVPFNPSIVSLPPDFKGDDVVGLYKRLSSIPSKGEFEATPAFYERLEKSVDYQRYYAFVYSPFVKYDADNQKLSFLVHNNSTGIESKLVYKGSYRATNAFGVSVTAYREDYDHYGIKNFCRLSISENLINHEIPAAPEEARLLKDNLRVVHIGRLYFTEKNPTFTSTELTGYKPTIDSPTGRTTRWLNVHMWVEQVWVFDKRTGKVLSRKADFLPRDDARTVSFTEEELRANLLTVDLPRLEFDNLKDYLGREARVEVIIGPEGNVESYNSLPANETEHFSDYRSFTRRWATEVVRSKFKPFYRNGRLVRAKGILTYRCHPNDTLRFETSHSIRFVKIGIPEYEESGIGAALAAVDETKKPREVVADLTVSRDGAIIDVVLIKVDQRIEKEPNGRERIVSILQKLRCIPVEVNGTRLQFITRMYFNFNNEYAMRRGY